MKIGYCIIITFLPWLSKDATAQPNAAQPMLKVGDKAPIISVDKWVKGGPVMRFEKGHAYLVEFGATWCQPCAEAVPRLTDIAKRYGDKLTVIGVFVMEYRKDSLDRSYVSVVENYVKNQGSRMEYHVAIDDSRGSMATTWLKAANLEGIPESFVVDKDGMIAWIGNTIPDRLSRVVGLVTDTTYRLADAVDASNFRNAVQLTKIDNLKPWSLPDNGGDNTGFLFRSMLNKYHGEVTNLNSDYVFTRTWAKWSRDIQAYNAMVQQIGVSLAKLYYLAYADTIGYGLATRYVDHTPNYPDVTKYPTLSSSYGKYWYRPILEVRDTAKFLVDRYSQENKYNYSLVVSDDTASAKFLQKLMQYDLKAYFGYEVEVKDSLMPCWKLVASDSARRLLNTKTPGRAYAQFRMNDTLFGYTNAVMKDILIRLRLNYSFGRSTFDNIRPPEEPPFVDETGITDEIDYNISHSEHGHIQNLDWWATMNFLHRWGLDLVKGEKLIRVVIIKDPQ